MFFQIPPVPPFLKGGKKDIIGLPRDKATGCTLAIHLMTICIMLYFFYESEKTCGDNEYS